MTPLPLYRRSKHSVDVCNTRTCTCTRTRTTPQPKGPSCLWEDSVYFSCCSSRAPAALLQLLYPQPWWAEWQQVCAGQSSGEGRSWRHEREQQDPRGTRRHVTPRTKKKANHNSLVAAKSCSFTFFTPHDRLYKYTVDKIIRLTPRIMSQSLSFPFLVLAKLLSQECLTHQSPVVVAHPRRVEDCDLKTQSRDRR